MDKRDYIDLIKVTEGIIKLEKGVEILSGKTFEEGEGVSVYYLWEILRRNASEKKPPIRVKSISTPEKTAPAPKKDNSSWQSKNFLVCRLLFLPSYYY